MTKAQKLRELAKGFTVLYVEDNENLRTQTTRLLVKFFESVYVGKDGKDGLELFERYRPKIVITDLRMPKMGGFEMCKEILEIEPTTKVIVTTAHDEKEYLLKSIDYGVFRFLKKPLVIEYLVQALTECLESIHANVHAKTFESEIEKIFNYQHNLVALLKEKRVVFANPKFFAFFGVASLPRYLEAYEDFGSHLHPQEGFLYNEDEIGWYEQICSDVARLFHVKLKNAQGEFRHCILSVHPVPGVADERILSFDDVTELGLMGLFEKHEATASLDKAYSPSLLPLLNVIHQNGAKVNLLNFYRGLTISNEATITSIKGDVITFKSAYFQLKIIHMENVSTLRSELLPSDVRLTCKNIRFEHGTLEAHTYHFLERSASDRKYVRVEPAQAQGTLTFNNKRHAAKVIDISNKAIKLALEFLPAGLERKSSVELWVEIPAKAEKIVFTCKGWVVRVEANPDAFWVVCMMELPKTTEKKLVSYIPVRQMELIREFKSL